MNNMDVNNRNRGARMTPAQFARDECSNMLPEGACLGVSANSLIDNSQPKTCTPRDRCLVTDGKRCDHFEHVILPLADKPSPSGDPGLQAKRASARNAYLGMNAMAKSGVKPCPTCGGPKPPGYQFCESCGAARRREKGRQRVRQHRLEKNGEPVTL